MLADLPDFNRIEKLHRATAPSEAAYNLIHCHCVVIATISWMLARHQNQLLAFKQLGSIEDFADKSPAGSGKFCETTCSRVSPTPV